MNSPLDLLAAAMPAGFMPMLTSDTRLYRVEGGGQLAQLHVEAFTLHEALHQPWQMILSCLSDAPLSDMAALRWQPITLVTALADGSEHRRTGLIEQAAVTDVSLSFGRPSRYRFTVIPWLGLLAYDWRSQVYQERTLVEIVDGVLSHYSAHGRWRWSPCALAYLGEAPQGGLMSYCMQYRESRLRFVQRLLAEAGLTYRFEESGIGEPATMMIVADTTSAESCPEDVSSASVLGGQGLRFHRAGPTEQQDGVTQFDASYHWSASTLTATTSDYKTGQVISASVPTLGRVGGPNAPAVESYVYAGAYAWPNNEAARRGLTAVQQAIEARRRLWFGRACVHSLTAGTHIFMRDTRMDDLGSLTAERPACLAAPDNRYLLTQITHVGINNLPAELLDRLGGVDADPMRRPGVDEIADLPGVDADLKREAALRGYANRFEATDASMPWRPMLPDADPGRLAPRPRIPGPLVATVVGPDGSTEPSGPDELYMDKLGRVRIRFEFQGHPGNDPLAGLSSTWVRVLQPVAGPGLGTQWIPRIGHEVLVGFMDDDADRPMVIRSLHNGRGEGGVPATPGGQAAEADTSVFASSTNHRPSAQGNLTGGASPAWHGGAPQSLEAGGQNNAAALSGIKTKEFGGEGFNQTVFDDTDGELRTQLATTQHASQLNMGHLIHQADNHRGSFRGRGFELRTDAYGALRGAKSVHLTTYGSAASDPALDQAGSIALAKQYQQLTQAFSQAAMTHQTVRLSAQEGSHKANASLAHDGQASAQAWLTNVSGMVDAAASRAPDDAAKRLTTPANGKLPHSTDPTVSVAARAGLVATAGQDIALTANDGVSLASGGTADAAIGGALRIHTGQAIGILSGAIEPSQGGPVPSAKGGGLTMIAGRGDLSLQAQAGTMHLASKGDLTIQSASAAVQFVAAKRIVIANSHGANITIADGKIVVTCPGTYTVKAGKKSMVGPQNVNASLPVLPTINIAPVLDSTLLSTFAHDQFMRVAKACSPVEFVALVVRIFGFDIPADVYLKLYNALRAGSIPPPEVVLMTGGNYPAAFDNKTRQILVHRAAPERSTRNNDESWELLMALLHEYGHYIDAVLRQDMAPKDADGNSLLAGDAPEEEGAKFAYEIAYFDLADSSQCEFATYQSPEYSGALRVNYNDARIAIRKAQGEEAQRDEGKEGSVEFFGAGRGEHAKDRPDISFGHQSIEDALADADPKQFDRPTRRKIYFGNWLRDYSQLLDPKIVRPPGLPKDLTKYISRDSLTDLVSVLAELEFVESLQDKPLFTVTREMLGVYRPVEHIDNPTNNDPSALDPRSIDPDFEPLPKADYLMIDPATSMKRYIAASREYMRLQIDKAAAAGPTLEGFRHFGAGLHVLEDYFAHSNFVELSLRKLGNAKVLPWTSQAPGKHPYPVVTGMFDSEDVIASTAGLIADHLFKVEWEFQASKPGVRTPSDRIMLILLRDHSDPTYLKQFQRYLWLRDEWASVPGHQYLEGLMHYTMGTVGNLYNFVYNCLLHLMGNSVDDEQVYRSGDPNTNGSTNPTHSQLAKDHDNHPFHTLAASLSKMAVMDVGRQMARRWAGDATASPGQASASYLVHPQDCSWQDAFVGNWAQTHAAQVKRGESSTEWEALRRAHEKDVRDGIDSLGQRSKQTWDYLNKHYEELFGQKNQVKP